MLYVAIILMSSSSTELGYAPLYEEAFWLIEAESRDQATERAVDATATENIAYRNANDHQVSWTSQLVDIGEALGSQESPCREVYSRFFRNIDAYKDLRFEDFRTG